MEPSATAMRSVSGLADTSTMRTSPFSSMWVSFWSVMLVAFLLVEWLDSENVSDAERCGAVRRAEAERKQSGARSQAP